jgi:hypothetical protein
MLIQLDNINGRCYCGFSWCHCGVTSVDNWDMSLPSICSTNIYSQRCPYSHLLPLYSFQLNVHMHGDHLVLIGAGRCSLMYGLARLCPSRHTKVPAQGQTQPPRHLFFMYTKTIKPPTVVTSGQHLARINTEHHDSFKCLCGFSKLSTIRSL